MGKPARRSKSLNQTKETRLYFPTYADALMWLENSSQKVTEIVPTENGQYFIVVSESISTQGD